MNRPFLLACALVLATSGLLVVFGIYPGGAEDDAAALTAVAPRDATPPETAGQDIVSTLAPVSTAPRSRTDSDLPVLPIQPEAFALSDANPFRCIRAETVPCDALADPMIARSPAEARWMSSRGYPTAAEREWARSRSADEIIAEARRRGSKSLELVGMERISESATSLEEARQAAHRLAGFASNEKLSYGLVAAARAMMRARTMAVSAEQPGSEARRAGDAQTAVSLIAEAMILGDSLAPRVFDEAINRRPPGVDTSLRPLEVRTGDLLFSQASFWRKIRYDDARAASGLGARGFTSQHIAPRPVPLQRRDFDATGAEILSEWVGEP